MTFPQNHKFGLPLRPNLDSTSVPFIILFKVILWYFLLKKVRFFWFFSFKEKNMNYLVMLLHSR